MNLKRGAKNIVYGFLGQIITIIISIIIPRMFIMSYGSEMNGLLASISQVLTYLSVLEAGVGAATIQALYRPITQRNTEDINGVMSATNIYYKRTGRIYLGLIVLVAGIYPFVVKSSISRSIMFAIVFINGIPSVINYTVQGKYKLLLQAEGKSYITTNITTIFNIVVNIIKIILIYYNINIILIQSVYIVISLMQMLVFMIYIRRNYSWLNVRGKADYSAINQKGAVLVHNIAGLIFNSTDMTILTLFCGLESVSIYAIYNSLFGMLNTAINTVNEGIRFILGQAYVKGLKYYIKILDVYENFFMAIIFSLCFSIYILILPFVRLYTQGSDINYINIYLPILFTAIKLIDAGRNTCLTTIYAAGTFADTKKQAVIECIINLSVSVVGVFKFGMEGVLIGTIVALVYRVIDTIIYTNHKILHRKATGTFALWGRNIFAFFIMALIFSRVDLYCDGYVEWTINAIIISTISIVVFGGMACICKPQYVQTLVRQVLYRIKGRQNLK